jgi:hypothetical protein
MNERSDVKWFTLEIRKLRWEAEKEKDPASSKKDYDINTLLECKKKKKLKILKL